MKKTSQINKKWADKRAAYYSSLTVHQKDVLDEMQRDVEQKVAIQESEKKRVISEINEYERTKTGFFPVAISFIVGGLLSLNITESSTFALKFFLLMTIVFSLICFSLLLAEQSLITKFFQPWIQAYDDIVDYINSMQWDSPDDINAYTVERQKDIPTKSNVPIQLLENLSLGIAFSFLTLILLENLFNPSWVELLSTNSQHIGLVSILVSWAGLLFLIWKWKGNGSMTFSQHAAQYKASIWYYRIMWSIVLPPFLYFMIYEYSEKLHMGLMFDGLVYFSVFLMLVAAVIPEVKGWQYHVHRFAAFVMAALFLPVLAIVVFSDIISSFSRVILIASMIYMIFSIISVWAATAIKNKVQEHPRMLLSQAIYIALFNLSILATYYL